MKAWAIATLLGALLVLPAAGPMAAEDIVFPPDAGVVDLTKPPYNAEGDGATDSTAAFNQALEDNNASLAILYVPNGTYMISDTLRWGMKKGHPASGTTLQDQGTGKAIIRLKDNCPGYLDPSKQKSRVWTGPAPAQHFGNSIRNLTIDSGKDLRGAVALQVIANNQGTLRDVLLRSGDGAGVCGLDMVFENEVGPCHIKNLTVDGFQVGVHCGNPVDSQTFERLVLRNQGECSLKQSGQWQISIRGLESTNSVPALVCDGGATLLIEARLEGTGGASTLPAIRNKGSLFCRDVVTTGYPCAVAGQPKGGVAPPSGPKIEEYCSYPAIGQFEGAHRSLRLPIKDTPEIPWDDPKDWASVKTFAKPGMSDAQAIQAAIDSGKTTVYLPRGSYRLGKETVLIRGKVRRLIGCEASLKSDEQGGGILKVVDGDAPVVVLERIQLGWPGSHVLVGTSRTVVLRHSIVWTFKRLGTGDLFFGDISLFCTPLGINLNKGQRCWARQLNVESEGLHILNDAGTLWVLGLKTERGGTIVESRNGARTEILGAFMYTTSGPGGKNEAPMFLIENSSFSHFGGEANFGAPGYRIRFRETRGSETKATAEGMGTLYVAAPVEAAGKGKL